MLNYHYTLATQAKKRYNLPLVMGIGQVVRLWVLVPGSGVRIPHPQPNKKPSLYDLVFYLVRSGLEPTIRPRSGRKSGVRWSEVAHRCLHRALPSEKGQRPLSLTCYPAVPSHIKTSNERCS